MNLSLAFAIDGEDPRTKVSRMWQAVPFGDRKAWLQKLRIILLRKRRRRDRAFATK